MTRKILIIEDDKALCEEMAEILEDEGYCVSVTFNGYNGKNLIERNIYDLLLLDLKLPGLHGLSILRSIKKKSKKPRVIVITGSHFFMELHKKQWYYKNQEEYLLKLADAVIHKPFDVEIVLGKIKELVGQNHQTINA
jgi:DNA-binding response OmpR family regulator